MSSMSSSAVINTLRLLFAMHGLPDVIVSDNGAAFTSTEFQEFADRNGIRHVTTARMVKLIAWYRQPRRPCLVSLEASGRPDLLVS